MGLLLTSSPAIRQKKSIDERCKATQEMETTDSALPNQYKRVQNHFLVIIYIPVPKRIPF